MSLCALHYVATLSCERNKIDLRAEVYVVNAVLSLTALRHPAVAAVVSSPPTFSATFFTDARNRRASST